jgi:hypothetical protein
MKENTKDAFKYLLDWVNMRIEQSVYHHLCKAHGNRDNACNKEKRAKRQADDLFRLFNQELRK